MTELASRLMIMDACVLIDFFKTDSSVLKLITSYVGSVYVVTTVLEEVNDIENNDDLSALGLVVIEPELEDLFAASAWSGPTSFQDRLCLLTAKRNQFRCVTNDKNLRSLCEEEGVDICWGLQLVVELHAAGGIPGQAAKDIAHAIHLTNPQHITPKIIEQFNKKIQSQER